VTDIGEWWSSGERVVLRLGEADRTIFVRRMGRGPVMTVLHGFPSSSHDWAAIAPALARDHALLMPDFLGFGASEKPQEHVYSLHEQADLVEALWKREGITSTTIVAHDYAVSVTQELLARRSEGVLGTEITAAHLLNGGLYPDLHRPPAAALALLDPEQGPRLSAALTTELFSMSLKPTFAETWPAIEVPERVTDALLHPR
jgi:pimeloyl-ACP methyl ester carboxylesterase